VNGDATLGFPLFPPAASVMADRVDQLFLFMLALTGLVTATIAALVLYFAFRYRRRSETMIPPQTTGSHLLEWTWALVPLAIFMIPFVWGAKLYAEMYTPPAGALEIDVEARQWMWKFQHPGGQKEINELHVPTGRPVKLTIASQDVIHSFFVPAFRMKQDAVPGRYTTVWFEAKRLGRYHLFCSEYCGTAHSHMQGWVTVMEPAEYESWLALGATQSLASEGAKLFQQLGCFTCHRPDSLRRGPVLAGLYGHRVQLADGTMVVADDTYIRESILDPAAKVVLGYQPIMPTFRGRVTEEQIRQLIAFIKSMSADASERAFAPEGEPLFPAGAR
jgi:cytochrome c oxidase subunit 2